MILGLVHATVATACPNDKRIDFLCTLKGASGPKMAHNADLLELIPFSLAVSA